MVNFLITLFFAAAMVCLLAVPLMVTLFFAKAHCPSRKKHLKLLAIFLAGFLLCLIISGRIYDANLTPEQKAALEQETTAAKASEAYSPIENHETQ